jgi:glucokinase
MRGGIDLGGTKIQAVVIDDDGVVRGQSRHVTPVEGGPPDIAAELVVAVTEAAAEAGLEPSDLEAVGVGSPGKVDDEAGTVTGARNLAGWEGSFDLRSALVEALGTPIVALGNDVDAGTLAEYELGAGKPFR